MNRRHVPPHKKPENTGKILKRLFSYLGKYRLLMIVVSILIILSSLAAVAGNAFVKPIIDEYILPLAKQKALGLEVSYAGLIKILIILCGIYLVGIISNYTYNRIMIVVSQSALKDIRDEVFKKMQRLPIRYFDTRTHGEIMSCYTNDVDTLRQMLSQSIPQLINSIITLVSVFIIMCIYSIPLTLLVIVMVILMMFVIKFVGGGSAKYFVKQQIQVAKVNGYIEELIDGSKVVKSFCHEEKAMEEFDVINEELFHTSSMANTFASILMPIMGNISYIHYSLTAILGSILVISCEGTIFAITTGTLLSFLSFTKTFTMPITQLSQQFNSVVMALAGAGRVFKILDEEPEVDNGYVTLVNVYENERGELVETTDHTNRWAWKHPHHDGTLTYTEVKGDVVLDSVDFGYVPEKTVLHDVSLYANPGQKIAFVGATGAGKTTITNLINRFYDVQDGKIRIDGININKIKKDDLRKSMAVVLQDTHLFTGTIKENIRYGRLDATDEEIYEAARLANADSFIKHLPDGYDTFITNDGANLSQGQRQLLSIARAAVANPPILVLDEATSSIDTRTEKLIEKGMDKLMEGRTVFVIAHRLSTIRNAQAIMVLENGRIIERGDHDDLINQHGKYYQLYTGAFELE